MAQLELRNIGKSFGTTQVLHDITLTVEDGAFLSLVGQSGCGKSTLLRIISGLETPSYGEILLDGVDVTTAAPKARNLAMVFQDYALYPHMSVAQNMAMPLLMARLPLHARLPLFNRFSPAARKAQPDIAAQVETVAKQLRIDHLLGRKPAALSGGQRQRVALGRALVRNPHLFLMDEPLSNLDAKLRVEVRREITELHAQSGLTFVYVTHDQVEAMTMSTQVALMQGGHILQAGSPDTLYSNPQSIDVARFIGAPEINILPAKTRDGALWLGETRLCAAPPMADVAIGIRPDMITARSLPGLIHSPQKSLPCTLPFRIRLIEDLGPELLIHGAFSHDPSIETRIRAQKAIDFAPLGTMIGQEIRVDLNSDGLLLFGADGKRITQDHRAAEMA